MKRETPNQKLTRELSDARRKLFIVCTEPDSDEAKRIMMEQLMYKGFVKIPTDFYLKLKELGLGRMPEKPFEHYEANK
jgi:hypothetical protein